MFCCLLCFFSPLELKLEKTRSFFFRRGGGLSRMRFLHSPVVSLLYCALEAVCCIGLFQVCSVYVHVLHDELCELDLVTWRTGFGYWL